MSCVSYSLATSSWTELTSERGTVKLSKLNRLVPSPPLHESIECTSQYADNEADRALTSSTSVQSLDTVRNG